MVGPSSPSCLPPPQQGCRLLSKVHPGRHSFFIRPGTPQRAGPCLPPLSVPLLSLQSHLWDGWVREGGPKCRSEQTKDRPHQHLLVSQWAGRWQGQLGPGLSDTARPWAAARSVTLILSRSKFPQGRAGNLTLAWRGGASWPEQGEGTRRPTPVPSSRDTRLNSLGRGLDATATYSSPAPPTPRKEHTGCWGGGEGQGGCPWI